MGGREVLELLGPGAVEELVGLALRLQLDLVLKLLTRHVLVHEALAVQVQPQKAVIADDAAAVGAGAAAHVVDHRRMPLLHRRAGPHAHLVAVADVGVVALRVQVQRQDLVAVLDARGGEVLHHVLVGQVVARGQDDAFRVDLQVLVRAGVLRVDARDATVIGRDELHALRVVAHLGAGLLSALEVVGHGRGQAGEAHGRGVARHVLFRVVVRFQHGIEVRVEVVGAVGLGDLLVGLGRDVHVRAPLDEPVERLARLVAITADDAEVRVVAPLLHVHVDHHVLIQEAVAAFPLGHGLAAQDGHVAGHAVELGGCLDGDDLRAGFGSRARCGDARAAKAHDHDVGVERLGHVAVGDGRRLVEPRHGARAVEAHRLAVARAGRARGTARDADHLRSATRQARTGKRRADGGSTGQEAAAADSGFVHVVPSSRLRPPAVLLRRRRDSARRFAAPFGAGGQHAPRRKREASRALRANALCALDPTREDYRKRRLREEWT